MKNAWVPAIGCLYRTLPPIRGRSFIARRFLAPWLRGRGLQATVRLRTPAGGRLRCNLDDWLPWNVFLHGRYQVEYRQEEALLAVARRSSIILDIGANIGYYTVQFSRCAKRGCRVFAFEALSYQFQVLQENLALNRIRDATTERCVVSDTPGVRRIYFAGMQNTGQSSVEIPTAQFEDVEAVTIDDYAMAHGLRWIDLVKIDVEGHELSVLQGMRKLLAQQRIANLFVEINSKTLGAARVSPGQIVDFFAAHGYHGFSLSGDSPAPYRGRNEPLVWFRPLEHGAVRATDMQEASA